MQRDAVVKQKKHPAQMQKLMWACQDKKMAPVEIPRENSHDSSPCSTASSENSPSPENQARESVPSPAGIPRANSAEDCENNAAREQAEKVLREAIRESRKLGKDWSKTITDQVDPTSPQNTPGPRSRLRKRDRVKACFERVLCCFGSDSDDYIDWQLVVVD